MSASCLPQETINAIQAKVRNFFWSSAGNKKLRSVSWKKITTPKAHGGLGLRDFRTLNEAMLVKNLWALASGKNALWAKVVAGKYFSRESLWFTSRTTRCTAFWRAIMQVRPLLSPHIKWQLGDGMSCPAFAQPWFRFWLHCNTPNAMQRGLVVSNFVDTQSHAWKTDMLIQHFGLHMALYIAISIPPPTQSTLHGDRIIFTYAVNGKFTFRKAYKLLAESHVGGPQNPPHSSVWQSIWQAKGILPRVRIFLWKGCHEALPVGEVISRRMRNASQPCWVCGMAAESISHVLFKCPRARQMWFSSKLAIRSDSLPDCFEDAFALLMDQLSSRDFVYFTNLLWAYWKLHCKEQFEGVKFTVQQVHSMATSFDKTASLAGLLPNLPRAIRVEGEQAATTSLYSCFIDGSYVSSDQAGWACVIMKGSILVKYCSGYGSAVSPLHAELKALKLAADSVLAHGLTQCTFITDCLNIEMLIKGTVKPDDMDWRVYPDCLEMLHLFNSYNDWICNHIRREDNQVADALAKYARSHNIEYVGFTFPMFSTLPGIPM